MPYTAVANEQVVDADYFNNNLMNQANIVVQTSTQRDSISNKTKYMLVAVTDDKTLYRWTGSKWHPWTSAWRIYYPTYENLNLGGGSPYGGYHDEYTRWENGLVKVRVKISLGAGASIGGEVRMGLPEPYYYNGFNTSNPYLDGNTWIKDGANGREFTGGIKANGSGPNITKITFMTTVSNDTFTYNTTWANSQPIAPSIYSEIWALFSYESANYPFNY